MNNVNDQRLCSYQEILGNKEVNVEESAGIPALVWFGLTPPPPSQITAKLQIPETGTAVLRGEMQLGGKSASN
jgi:hypothetical protein